MLDIRTILVPVDLSATSGPAVQHGVNIANHFKADLIVLHAIPSLPYDPALASGYPGGVVPDPSVAEGGLDRELAEFLNEAVPGHEPERIVVSAEPVPLIKRVVQERHVDLLVMPISRHRRTLRRFLFGSVTTKILNEVECPILTGLHVEHIPPTALQPYKRIGCVVSLGDYSIDVLEKARDFAGAYGADLTVIHALSALDESPPVTGTGSRPEDSLPERAKAAIDQLLETAKISAQSIVKFGSLEEVVSTAVAGADLGLLVIGRHNRQANLNGWRADAFGVIRTAPCPVLSV